MTEVKKIGKWLTGILLAALIVSFTSADVHASVHSGIAIDDTKQAVLSIYYRVTENGKEVPIEGAEFGIYEVGTLDENGEYQVTEGFKSTGAEAFSSLTTTEKMLEAAKEYAKTAGSQQPAQKAVTGSDGRLTFSPIPAEDFGIYLVTETAGNGAAEGFETAEPYLIQLPTPQGDGTWLYTVEAQPKTDRIPEKAKEPTAPKQTKNHGTAKTGKKPARGPLTVLAKAVKTGDTRMLMVWTVLLIAAGIVILGAAGKHRRDKR